VQNEDLKRQNHLQGRNTLDEIDAHIHRLKRKIKKIKNGIT